MKRIRWGILGAAKIARDFVIPAIQASRHGYASALASRDPDRGAQACDRFGIPNLMSDYESLVTAPEVDAVYIPLPNELHVQWALRDAAAGKHVLCEKPLALHASEIDALIEARDRHLVVIGEAFMTPHHPQWQLTRKWIGEGRIGKLRMIEGGFTYHNVDPNNIRNRPPGGGGLRDIGVYLVLAARMVTGEEPRVAHALIDWDPTFGIDRLVVATLDCGGVPFQCYCGTQAARRQQMTFHGDKGWLRLDTPFNTNVYDMARLVLRMTDSPTLEETIFPQVNQYELMVENFSEAIAGKERYALSLESSRANQKVIDDIFDAAELP